MIPQEDWDAGSLMGDGGVVVGHEVKVEPGQLVGYRHMWGWLYTPNTLLSAPFRAKVVSIRPVHYDPGAVMLSVVSAATTAPAGNKLHYSLISNVVEPDGGGREFSL